MNMITQEKLKEVLNYNPDTGVFTWKVKRGNASPSVGTMAGTYMTNGYLKIQLYGKPYMGHRLAWLYVHGLMPLECIDHKNGNPSDNRIVNLREADRYTNGYNRKSMSNNTSGYKGVDYHKQKGKWRCSITTEGVRKYLGYFNTPEEAYEVLKRERIRVHKEFARHE